MDSDPFDWARVRRQYMDVLDGGLDAHDPEGAQSVRPLPGHVEAGCQELASSPMRRTVPAPCDPAGIRCLAVVR